MPSAQVSGYFLFYGLYRAGACVFKTAAKPGVQPSKKTNRGSLKFNKYLQARTVMHTINL